MGSCCSSESSPSPYSAVAVKQSKVENSKAVAMTTDKQSLIIKHWIRKNKIQKFEEHVIESIIDFLRAAYRVIQMKQEWMHQLGEWTESDPYLTTKMYMTRIEFEEDSMQNWVDLPQTSSINFDKEFIFVIKWALPTCYRVPKINPHSLCDDYPLHFKEDKIINDDMENDKYIKFILFTSNFRLGYYDKRKYHGICIALNKMYKFNEVRIKTAQLINDDRPSMFGFENIQTDLKCYEINYY